MRNKYRGFSLIELVVVISIVLILAAAALNILKDRIRAGKIIAAVKNIDSYAEKLKMYYEIRDQFPTLEDIGLTPTTPGGNATATPSSLSEYISEHVSNVLITTDTTPGQCPYFRIEARISNVESNEYFGVDSDGDSIRYRTSFFLVNGNWEHLCYYWDLNVEGGSATNDASTNVNTCYNMATFAEENAAYIREAELINACN